MKRSAVTIAQERERINKTIRSFFDSKDFVEVETPIMVRSPGMEPNLMPFESLLLNEKGEKNMMGLITSPEYSMKKLLGEGLQKIFTLTKVFRNGEDLRGIHNPEFSMLEWYQQGVDYQECMNQTEALVKAVVPRLKEIEFKRVRVNDLFIEHIGLNLDHAKKDDLMKACERLEIHFQSDDSESDLFYRLFLDHIEPHLGKDPIFVYDYPIHQAALARLTPDGLYGERFELYIDGLELCNGFSELTDAKEQRARFIEEAQERAELGKTVFPIDEELLRLLPSLQSPTAGNALGIDRLHMVYAGVQSIDDVLLFPASNLLNNDK